MTDEFPAQRDSNAEKVSIWSRYRVHWNRDVIIVFWYELQPPQVCHEKLFKLQIHIQGSRNIYRFVGLQFMMGIWPGIQNIL